MEQNQADANEVQNNEIDGSFRENVNSVTISTEPVFAQQPRKNINWVKVILVGVVLGLVFWLGAIFKELINLTKKETISNKINDEVTPTTIPTITPIVISNVNSSLESTLVEKDADNNLYTNNKFGFSLVVPKFTLSSVECKKETDSYRPALGFVPVNYFENSDVVYLAANYFYNLIGEQRTLEGKSNFSGCEGKTTTFNLIEESRLNFGNIANFKIYATNIKNESELASYIKSKYGSGCRLGKKTESKSQGVYSVEILSDGKDLEESECPINFVIVTMYNPEKEKLVMFELGQACNLSRDQSINSGCDDTGIVESLKFN